MGRTSIIDILMDKIGELEYENRTIKTLARAVLGDLEPKLMTDNERALKNRIEKTHSEETSLINTSQAV